MTTVAVIARKLMDGGVMCQSYEIGAGHIVVPLTHHNSTYTDYVPIPMTATLPRFVQFQGGWHALNTQQSDAIDEGREIATYYLQRRDFVPPANSFCVVVEDHVVLRDNKVLKLLRDLTARIMEIY